MAWQAFRRPRDRRDMAVCAFLACFAMAFRSAPELHAHEHRSPHLQVHPAPDTDVRWTEGFWADKFALCEKAILAAVEAGLTDRRNGAQLANFRVAAGLEKGKHAGCDWIDGDCYKWLETAAHVYAVTRNPQLYRTLDQWIEIIAKCQAKDGYLSTNIMDRYFKRYLGLDEAAVG